MLLRRNNKYIDDVNAFLMIYSLAVCCSGLPCRFGGGLRTTSLIRRHSRGRSTSVLTDFWTEWNATTVVCSSRTRSVTSPRPRTDSVMSRWRTFCRWMMLSLTTCFSTGCLPFAESRRCLYRASRFVTKFSSSTRCCKTLGGLSWSRKNHVI